MTYKELLIEKSAGVCVIKFNRPKQMNAFNTRLTGEFVDALLSVDKETELKVVIITGVGSTFSAGIDIEEAIERMEGGNPILSSFENMVPTQGSVPWIPFILKNMKKPVIASINGPAIGAGFSIALACDIRISSEKAKVGAPFGRVGLMPEFGSTYNLPRLVGIAKACELVFTGDIIGAKEMKEIGLVNRVVPEDELEKFTRQMAEKIARWPSLPIQVAKRALYQGLDSDLVSQLQLETLGMGMCAKTEDHLEGLKAFIEKRNPVFQEK